MKYDSGVEIQLGDHIDLDGSPSIVEVIIETEEDMSNWGVQEIGIIVLNDSMGRVFQTVDSIDWDAVEFVERNEEPMA